MLSCPADQRGLTLIELTIALGIAAMLLAVAAPNFADWIRNTRIRTAAEAFQNGLQLARAEAVRRNTLVRFQITDTVTAACVLSSTGTNWLVSLNDVTGKCNRPPEENPFITQVRTAAEGSANTVVTAGQSVIIFNGLGRVTPLPANAINIDIADIAVFADPPDKCVASGGSLRCLRAVVSAIGQVRICDPAGATGDPRRC